MLKRRGVWRDERGQMLVPFVLAVGVILLAVLSNGLNLINMSSYVQLVAIGLIVMAASVGSVIRGRRQED